MSDTVIYARDAYYGITQPIKLVDNGDGTYSFGTAGGSARIFTSTSTSTTTLTCAALADVASEYVGQMAVPQSGAMAGEGRTIISYNGTNTITVSPAWAGDPGGIVVFAIIPSGSGSDSLVPTADSTDNTYERDVIGNKTDTASTVKNNTDSVVSYLKGILDLLGVPTTVTGTFTDGSSASAPIDTGIGDTYGANYFIGSKLIPLTGSARYQCRTIIGFTSGGIFTLDRDFTTAPGAVSYIIVPNAPGTALITLGTITTATSTSVLVDINRTEATGHWDGCLLIPLSGLCALQPRIIDTYITGGTFNMRRIFNNTVGTVKYLIIPRQSDQLPKDPGQIQLISRSLTTGTSAGTTNMFLVNTAPVLIKSFNLKWDSSVSMTNLTSISIQTSDTTTPSVLIKATDGIAANLTDNANLSWSNYGSTIYLATGKYITMTIVASGSISAHLPIFTCEYTAVTSGGYLTSP